MAIKQEVNSQLIITVGVMSGLLLVVIIIGLQAWFIFEEKQEVQEKWRAARDVQLETVMADQRERLSKYGATTIPVEEAMKVLAQRGGKVTFARAPATQGSTRPTTRPTTRPGQ